MEKEIFTFYETCKWENGCCFRFKLMKNKQSSAIPDLKWERCQLYSWETVWNSNDHLPGNCIQTTSNLHQLSFKSIPLFSNSIPDGDRGNCQDWISQVLPHDSAIPYIRGSRNSKEKASHFSKYPVPILKLSFSGHGNQHDPNYSISSVRR